MDSLKVKRALLSVTDKSGLEELAIFLSSNGVELVSTGGTYKYLEDRKIPVTPINDVTGFPEILDGRVKTLHPKVHGGILADKDNQSHLDTLQSHSIQPFDLVCVNLYNFKGALDKKLSTRETIEEIDIGGPCLLRASSKNYYSVLVLPAVSFYADAINELKTNNMHVGIDLRKRTAAAAFAATSIYDEMIAKWILKGV